MSIFIPKKNSKPKPKGTEVSGGEFKDKPKVVASPAIRPIEKPGKNTPKQDERPLEIPPAPKSPWKRVEKAEAITLSPTKVASLPRNKPKGSELSPTQATAQKPKPLQSWKNISIEPMDPKSAQWESKIDIKDMRRAESIAPPTSQLKSLKNVQSRAPRNFSSSKGMATNKIEKLEELFDSLTIENEKETKKEDEQLSVPGLIPKLMPHQVAGVKFLIKREDDKVSGGMLCDDMGLGKTVQSIALILKTRPNKNEIKNGTTLVIAPLAVMFQWVEEIKSKAPTLSVTHYQGPKRAKNVKDLQKYDVVVTTYDTVLSEFKKIDDLPPLFSTSWFRLIADEAHQFRNPETQLSKAMSALKSDGRRWAVTGTPTHNTVDDLFSLFRFIKVEPYTDKQHWKHDISDPIKKNGPRSEQSLVLLRNILHTLMIRRRQEVVKLPECKKHYGDVTLNKTEKARYDDWMKQLLNRGKNGAMVVQILTRLRQTCDDIALLPEEEENKTPAKENAPKDDISDLVSDLDFMSLSESDDVPESSPISSKSSAVLKILKKDPQRKTVIFSSYARMLRIFAKALDKENIACRIYDGQLSPDSRKRILEEFSTKDIPVLLCSLNCAAVGINIICASQVVMFEPWWNPMIVDQAINRVHRIGQTKKVDVYEMRTLGTMEERTFTIQDKKRALARNLLSSEKQTKLSKEDLNYILYGY